MGAYSFHASSLSVHESLVSFIKCIRKLHRRQAYELYALVICDYIYIANLRFLFNIGQTLYYGANYPRLKQLKDQYDPVDTLNFPTAIQE